MDAEKLTWISLGDEAIERFARQAGVLSENHHPTEALREFTLLIAEQCAELVEEYNDEHEGNAADAIRAVWGLG